MAEFHGTVTIRFGDVDNAGIVYFPRILHHIHTVFEDFFRDAVQIPYDRIINKRRIGFPTVHIRADFVKRMSYGDVLDVALSVPRTGRSSADFRYRMSSKRTGHLLSDITITVVAVNMAGFTPIEIPRDLREVFLRFTDGRPAQPKHSKKAKVKPSRRRSRK